MTDNTTEIPTMITFDEDIGNVEAPSPLPVGEYIATVVACEIKKSVEKQTPYAAVTFRIDPSAYPVDFADEGNPNGTKLVYRMISLIPEKAAMFRLRKFLEVLGAPTGNQIDVAEWIGCEAIAVVTNESYQGEMRANVNSVKSAA